MASALRDTTVGEIERRLEQLREGDLPVQRTSVATHMAWVPPEWQRAVSRVMHGLGERVPSRTLLIHPDPHAAADRIDAEIEQECFPGGGRDVCAEVVRLWLRGATAKAPASVVVPLHIADLPVYLRWRGKPPFGRTELEQLVGVSDRLIVDSTEWTGLPGAYARLAELFDRVVVSDLAWARGLRFRGAIAGLWPDVKDASSLHVEGPRAEALLLCGWLRSRLRHPVRLRRHEAPKLTRVEVDGVAVNVPPQLAVSASDLLSDQFEISARDRIYEAAVKSV